MINEGVYLVKPELKLLKNKIYKFKYDKLDYSKAFQTSDDLKIYSSYPGDNSSQYTIKNYYRNKF